MHINPLSLSLRGNIFTPLIRQRTYFSFTALPIVVQFYTIFYFGFPPSIGFTFQQLIHAATLDIEFLKDGQNVYF